MSPTTPIELSTTIPADRVRAVRSQLSEFEKQMVLLRNEAKRYKQFVQRLLEEE